MSLIQDNNINIQQAVPFFWVTNIEASMPYYVNGLGFTITNRWVDDGKTRWCWLQRDSAALMLQELQKDVHHVDVPSENGLGFPFTLFAKMLWRCIESLYQKMWL